jgi:predicted NBD/HSP70 family sugar kinase
MTVGSADYRSQRGYEVSGELAAGVVEVLGRARGRPVSLQEVARALGVRPSTVSRVAVVLRERDGLVEQAPKQPQKVHRLGRPTQPLQLATDPVLIGLSISDITDLSTADPGPDASVSRLVAVATRLDGTRVNDGPEYALLTTSQLKDPSGQALATAVAKVVRELTRQIGSNAVAGVGLALGGVIDKGVASRSCNLAWPGPVSIEESLQAQFPGQQVAVENDANAMLVHEAWRRDWGIQGGQPPKDFIVVIVREDGIGGALYVDGRRLAGHRGAAGELGHFKVAEAAQLKCRCGAKGCLESFAAPRRVLGRLEERGIAAAKSLMSADADADAARAQSTFSDFEQVHSEFSRAGDVLGREIARAATWSDPAAVMVFLPREIIESRTGSPGAAYRDSITSAMQEVYPEPPELHLVPFSDADVAIPEAAFSDADVAIAKAAATVSFDRSVQRLHQGGTAN